MTIMDRSSWAAAVRMISMNSPWDVVALGGGVNELDADTSGRQVLHDSEDVHR